MIVRKTLYININVVNKREDNMKNILSVEKIEKYYGNKENVT